MSIGPADQSTSVAARQWHGTTRCSTGPLHRRSEIGLIQRATKTAARTEHKRAPECAAADDIGSSGLLFLTRINSHIPCRSLHPRAGRPGGWAVHASQRQAARLATPDDGMHGQGARAKSHINWSIPRDGRIARGADDSCLSRIPNLTFRRKFAWRPHLPRTISG